MTLSLIGDVLQNGGTRPEEFQRPQVIGLTQAILHNQLHPEPHPRTHQLRRQHGRYGGNLTDIFHGQGKIRLRQFAGQVQPGGPVVRRQHADDVRRDPNKLHRHVGLPIGKLQPRRQHDSSLRRFEQTQQDRTLFKESQGQGP